eukprot:5595229-Prymnesium_polylepis.1
MDLALYEWARKVTPRAARGKNGSEWVLGVRRAGLGDAQSAGFGVRVGSVKKTWCGGGACARVPEPRSLLPASPFTFVEFSLHVLGALGALPGPLAEKLS